MDFCFLKALSGGKYLQTYTLISQYDLLIANFGPSHCLTCSVGLDYRNPGGLTIQLETGT